jgi:AcrR family transcriptional regulator
MGRWEDNAVGRLQEAALELYRDPGYDKVTVAEIAERAGLMRRTFFRYFPDTREVLFFGAERLEAFVAEAILAAPATAPAFEVVATAVVAVARQSEEDGAFSDFLRQRHALIRTYAELAERELGKLASLASAMTGALRRRGVADRAARLAAEMGVGAFKVGFERWVDDPKRRTMVHHVREAIRGFVALARELPVAPGKGTDGR